MNFQAYVRNCCRRRVSRKEGTCKICIHFDVLESFSAKERKHVLKVSTLLGDYIDAPLV